MVAIHSRFGFCSSCAVLVAAQLWQVGFPVGLLERFVHLAPNMFPAKGTVYFKTVVGQSKQLFSFFQAHPALVIGSNSGGWQLCSYDGGDSQPLWFL